MNNRQPEWDLYRSFRAVMLHGSLSSAARALGLTQPTIGRHIASLEEAIGTELFTRSQSGLQPTEMAIRLRPYADALSANADAFLRTASEQRETIGGIVRISASEVISVEVLPSILAPLQNRYPQLVFEVSASDTVEDLVHREADIAVRMAEPTQDTLLVQRIGDIPIGFFAHRDYLEKHGTPETLEELKNHRLIGFDRQTAYVRIMQRRHPDIGDIRFSFKADSNLAQLGAIRAGLGIGLCQIGLTRNNPDLVQLLAGEFSLPLSTWVVMHENLKGSPRCRATFDALVQGLRVYQNAVR